jgi:hypothetical protein
MDHNREISQKQKEMETPIIGRYVKCAQKATTSRKK